MTWTLDLSPEATDRLQQAQAEGMNVDALLSRLVVEQIETVKPMDAEAHWQALLRGEVTPPPMTPERLQAFLKEFQAQGIGPHYLRPEAFDRENLYEDRL